MRNLDFQLTQNGDRPKEGEGSIESAAAYEGD